MPREECGIIGIIGQQLLQIEDALSCDAKNGQERAAVGEAAEAIADGPLRVQEDHSGAKGYLSPDFFPDSPSLWEQLEEVLVLSETESQTCERSAIGKEWLQISGLKSVAKVFHLFPLLSDPMGKSSSLFFFLTILAYFSVGFHHSGLSWR